MLTGRDNDYLKIVVPAARRGDIAALEDYCGQHPEWLRFIGPHGRTLLWEAARGGKVEAVAWLRERGADAKIPGCYHRETTIELTPHGIALVKKRKRVVSWLEERGFAIDVYTQCYVGDEAAVRDALRADPELVTRPLTRPSQPARQDVEYAVPLLGYAVAGGHVELARLLLERGARCDFDGQRVVRWASWSEKPALLELVLEHGAKPEPGQAADWIEEPALLEVGRRFGIDFDIDAWNTHGFPPLVEACRGNHNAPDDPERVRAILELGARVDAVDYKGKTALHRAMQAGIVRIPELLREHGADLDARDKDGETPLFDCVRKARVEAVRWLLEHGANTEAENKRGQTARTLAKRSKQANAPNIRALPEKCRHRA